MKVRTNGLKPYMNNVFIGTILVITTGCSNTVKPPYTDYCELLGRDIQGKKHSFIAGNLMNYIGGQAGAEYDVFENETIGFTHPLFDDTRTRGLGLVEDEQGIGHEYGGWDFYRHEKIAYGTVILDGKEYKNPAPKGMIWRPDRVICKYEVGGVTIEEVKFITDNDVLVDMISASRPVDIRFEGQSFFIEGEVPEYYNAPPGTPIMSSTGATARYDLSNKSLHVTERDGIVRSRVGISDDHTSPSVESLFSYEGMSKVLIASADMSESLEITREETGQQVYSFILPCDEEGLVLTYAMDDNYDNAVKRSEEIQNDPAGSLAAKTDFMNDLLNYQIPYFRCSDEKFVETYYYLWSLYFMYFRDVGAGYTPHPYTVTAINNFRTLFNFDAVTYIAMAGWVKDRPEWGYGNALNWINMLPYVKEGMFPDTFGAHWWSPVYVSTMEFHVELAWISYKRTGDLNYIGQLYPFYKAVYDQKPIGDSPGRQILAIDNMINLATVLGHANDVAEYKKIRNEMMDDYPGNWEVDTPNYFGSGKIKDVWNLAELYCPVMPDEWAKAMTYKWVLNSEDGFWGEVPVNVRAFDSPQLPPFIANSINTYFAAEGMFRHNVDSAAIAVTLGHYEGMVKDYGFPVAPEAWDSDYRPWGSQYYGWDEIVVLLPIERLAGVEYSSVDDKFVVSEHLPEVWDFVEVMVPVSIDGKTHWVHARTAKEKGSDGITKTITVRNNAFKDLIIEPWVQGRKVVSTSIPDYKADLPAGHVQFDLSNKKKGTVSVTYK